MTCTGTVGNVLWLIFGGWLMALSYIIFGLLLCVTIIGIPFAVQVWKLAGLALWPFGKTVVDTGTAGCCQTLVNVLWFIIGGWEIALLHVLHGILFGITIVGIPCAKQHFKMAWLILCPFGKEVVTEERVSVHNYV